jgi:hypothetical protein
MKRSNAVANGDADNSIGKRALHHYELVQFGIISSREKSAFLVPWRDRVLAKIVRQAAHGNNFGRNEREILAQYRSLAATRWSAEQRERRRNERTSAFAPWP